MENLKKIFFNIFKRLKSMSLTTYFELFFSLMFRLDIYLFCIDLHLGTSLLGFTARCVISASVLLPLRIFAPWKTASFTTVLSPHTESSDLELTWSFKSVLYIRTILVNSKYENWEFGLRLREILRDYFGTWLSSRQFYGLLVDTSLRHFSTLDNFRT